MHLKIDLMPDEYTVTGVTKAFSQGQNIENQNVCLLRAQVANPDLPKLLNEMG